LDKLRLDIHLVEALLAVSSSFFVLDLAGAAVIRFSEVFFAAGDKVVYPEQAVIDNKVIVESEADYYQAAVIIIIGSWWWARVIACSALEFR
jgi:hypothetical protein